jgi:hypothetical protein
MPIQNTPPEADGGARPLERLVRLPDWIMIEKEPPHNDVMWVKILAHIRKNETGEVRVYETDMIMDEDDIENNQPSTYMWSDGNYCCDCNRKRFFEYALKDGRGFCDIETECSDGQFSVTLQNPKTKEYFYKEY